MGLSGESAHPSACEAPGDRVCLRGKEKPAGIVGSTVRTLSSGRCEWIHGPHVTTGSSQAEDRQGDRRVRDRDLKTLGCRL